MPELLPVWQRCHRDGTLDYLEVQWTIDSMSSIVPTVSVNLPGCNTDVSPPVAGLGGDLRYQRRA